MRMPRCRFRVLDECDEMLNMGFADDVEAILASAADSAAVQARPSRRLSTPFSRLQRSTVMPQLRDALAIGQPCAIFPLREPRGSLASCGRQTRARSH